MEVACSIWSIRISLTASRVFPSSQFVGLKQYARLIQVRPGWWEYWQSFHFTHALLPNDYSLVPALERAGWRRIYRDQTATLLVPGTT